MDCSPPQGLSKNVKFWAWERPNFGEILVKVQIFDLNIACEQF